jgi:hypothetical protein
MVFLSRLFETINTIEKTASSKNVRYKDTFNGMEIKWAIKMPPLKQSVSFKMTKLSNFMK